jgi:class 3 adenylate cyclase
MKESAVSQLDRQTRMAAVVFADIVGFSKKSVPAQLAAKEELARLLQRLVTPYPASSRIVLDTGDGAAVGFLVSPEYALSLTLRLRRELDGAPDDSLLRSGDLRLGINLGPLKVVTDVNGHPNMVGEGINSAERIMSFAAPGETTASRSFQEAVFYLDASFQTLFEPLGLRADKHGREHEVFRLSASAQAIDAALQSLGAAGRTTTAVATSTRSRSVGAGLIAALAIVGLGIGAWVAWPARQGTRELPAATSAAPREPAPPAAPAAAPISTPAAPSSAPVTPPAPAIPAPAATSVTPPAPAASAPAERAAATTPPVAATPAPAAPPASAPADAAGARKPRPAAPPSKSVVAAPPAPHPGAPPAPTPQPSARCSRLLQRAALGETLTPDEQREMTTSCR